MRPQGGRLLRYRVQNKWSGFVYAIGRIVPQFPSLGVEKEFAQLTDGIESGGTVETALLRQVLSDPQNRYLGRHLCWVFTSQHVETFSVLPRDDSDLTRLIEMLPTEAGDDVVHVVVGRFGRSGFDTTCDSLNLPSIVPDQLLAFTLDEFIEAMPDMPDAIRESDNTSSDPEQTDNSRPDETMRQFRAVIRGVYPRLTRRADNHGMSDEHRALNYVSLRYPAIYHMALQAHRESKVLVNIETRPTPSAARRLVSIRLTFRQRRTDIVEHYHCLVDVTDVFPFLASPLTLVYD
jgi:hypothetical protein